MQTTDNIKNYTTDWNGIDGSEVLSFINKNLKNLEELLNDKVEDISFEANGNEVTYTVRTSNSTKTDKFKLVPVSTNRFDVSITLDSIYNVYSVNEFIQIPYSYKYITTENGVDKANSLTEGSAKFEIYLGDKLITKLNAGAAYANRTGNYILKLDTNLLNANKENNLKIKLVYDNGSSKTESTVIENLQVTIIDFNDIDFNILDYTERVDSNFNKTILTSIGNSKLSLDYDIYAKGTINEEVKIENNTISYDLLKQISTNNTTITNQIKIYLYAKIKSTNNNGNSRYINTNKVLYYLSPANVDNTIASMIKINDVDSSDIPYLNVNQYELFNIKVKLFTSDKVTTKYSFNGTNLKESELSASKSYDDNLTYSFKTVQSGTLGYSISNNSIIALKLNVLSIGTSVNEPTNNIFNLTANGKTSDSKLEWSNNNYTAQFKGFNSGNGWSDSTLIVNSNAILKIPCYILNNEAFTASFTFKTENSDDSEQIISCYNGDSGFVIYPNKAVFYANSSLYTSCEFDGSEEHMISFVKYKTRENNVYSNLLAIYIDDTLQRTINYSTFTQNSSPIIITSTNTSTIINNINLYNKDLSYTDIQSLYILNNNDISKISEYVINNNVFDVDTTSPGYYGSNVDPDKLPAGSAIMLIETFKTDTDLKTWEIIDTYDGANGETNKGIKHLIKSAKFIVKNDNKALNVQEANPRNFYAYIATLSAQGTSSMYYPIKNFRLYFAKKANVNYGLSNYTGVTEVFEKGIAFKDMTNTESQSDVSAKYSLYSTEYGDSYTSAPAKLFCFKADYAESSGTHNTGFAKMSNDALIGISVTDKSIDRTPPQKAVTDDKTNSYKYDIRTSIDGRPIYLFFKEEDSDTYIYHGKYNMNNEKKSEDVFGFKGITPYFNNSVVQKESENLKTLFINAGYNSVVVDKYINLCHETEGSYINPTECWEFSSNVTSLPENSSSEVKGKEIPMFEYPYIEGKYDPFTVKNDNKLIWINQAWEYRFPDLEGEGDEAYRNGDTQPLLLKSLYRWLYTNNITRFIDETEKVIAATRFAKNLHKYFNVNNILIYYVLTKWYMNVDQRVKNCMIAFWCDPDATNNNDTETPMGHMRAYYIFYDNDTILGIDNAGSLTVPWDAKETWINSQGVESSFPGYGHHAIWDTLEYCYKQYTEGNMNNYEIYSLGELISETYKKLRTTISSPLGEINNIKNYFPTSIKNVDHDVKYLGYELIQGKEFTDNYSNLSKDQGTREYHRELWFNKRTNLLDGKYQAGDYTKNSYQFKIGKSGDSASITGIISLQSALDEQLYQLSFNSSKKNSSIANINDTVKIQIPDWSFNVSDFIQLCGLYSAKVIDLSNVDFGDAIILDINLPQNNLPYLTTLNWNTNNSAIKRFSVNTLVNNKFSNVQNLYLCNLKYRLSESTVDTSFSAIDLSMLKKLETLDLRGTEVNTLTLPVSNTLKTLQLESINSLKLTNKTNLIVFTISKPETLTDITVDNCNNLVYNVILQNCITNNISPTLKFGSENNPFEISETNIELLGQLAKKGANKNISGYIYYTGTNTEAVRNIQNNYDNIVIVKNTSITYDFDQITTYTLEEGESIFFSVSQKVSSWKLNITGDDSLKELIKITDSKAYSCTVSANLDNYNIDRSGTFTLTAIREDSNNNRTTQSINIVYEKINSLTISINDKNDIINPNIATNINYSVDNSKKLHLIKNLINSTENISSLFGNVEGFSKLSSTNSILFTYSGNDDEINLLMNCSELNLVSNTLTLLVNSQLELNIANLTETSKYYWMRQIISSFAGENLNNYSNPYISLLKQIPITSFNPTSKSEQDLTYLKYFKGTTSLEITMSSEDILSNINLPNEIKKFTLTITSEGSKDYGTIVFNKNLLSTKINVNFSGTIVPQICFDYSKTKIKTILGCDSTNINSMKDYVSQVSITHIGDSTSDGINNTSNSNLFIYPNTLETLGEITSDSATSNKTTIFKTETAKSELPFYRLETPGTTSNRITLGRINNYSTSPVSSIISLNNVKELKYAFYNGSKLLASESTINIPVIGDYTFANCSNLDYTIKTVTSIGIKAFSNANFISKFALDCSDVLNVGENAFLSADTRSPLTLKFSNSNLNIQSNSFYFVDNPMSTITIIFDKNIETLNNVTATTFGLHGEISKSKVIVVAKNEKLYEKLSQISNLTDNITLLLNENN